MATVADHSQGCSIALPGESVGPNSAMTFCAQQPGTDAQTVNFHYAIQVPNGSGGWKNSGFYMDGYAKVPWFVGTKNELVCNVKADGSTYEINWAPYICSLSWEGSGLDPKPVWAIDEKPVDTIDAITNPGAAADLIGANCAEYNTDQCTWSNTKTSAFVLPQGKWSQLTNVHGSCPPETKEAELTWGETRTLSWSDNIGGKVSAKAGFSFFKKAEATVEVSYSHTVSESRSFTESIKKYIPLKHQGALYLAMGVVEVRGTFVINSPGRQYRVNDAIVDFPLKNTFQPPGQGGQPIPIGIVEAQYWTCGQAGPPPAPVTHSPGLHVTK